MHIHNQPVNLYATNIHPPATLTAQQAAETRRRLTREASSLSEESDAFESFMVGQVPEETSRRQRSHDRPSGAKALVAEEEEPTGTLPHAWPQQMASTRR
jgi:hypothetical protein